MNRSRGVDNDVISSEEGPEAVPHERAVKPINNLARNRGRGERLDLDPSLSGTP
jgi:hypothetical protein